MLVKISFTTGFRIGVITLNIHNQRTIKYIILHITYIMETMNCKVFPKDCLKKKMKFFLEKSFLLIGKLNFL